MKQHLTNDSNSDVTGDLQETKSAAGPAHSGKSPISTLGQAVANFAVDPTTGKLTQQDFFVPLGYFKLNAGDKDFSSGGVALLDPVTFSGGGINRIALAGGKSGTMYVMDAENLGGYKTGKQLIARNITPANSNQQEPVIRTEVSTNQ